MALQNINLGSEADDGTGDNLRDGGDKINDNFLELYTKLGDASDLSSGISATASVITLTAPSITGVVGGTQTSATITTLATTTVNGTTGNFGTAILAAGSLTDSSGAISFGNENLTGTGTLSIGAITTDAVMNINTAVSTGTVDMFLVEGTANDFETTFDVTDPTADRTITFEDVTGTVVSTGSSRLVTGAMTAVDTIAEANMADDAIGSDQLKTLVTLLIKNSGGSTLKTIYGAGA
jgi:hypothetical protein